MPVGGLAVGDPLRRFAEDGLRTLRACRFAAQLGFEVEDGTLAAIPQRLTVARKVAVERALTELTKLLCGAEPQRGLDLLAATGLLDLWLPELRPMLGCGQNRHHRWDVWRHSLEVARWAPAEPGLRWAALLHDVGKPGARTVGPEGEVRFHGHEAMSLQVADTILERLKALEGRGGTAVASPPPAWAATRRKRATDSLPFRRPGPRGSSTRPCLSRSG